MNAERRGFDAGSFWSPCMSTPMRRTRSPCCARATTGHAAALPSPAMNSRRLCVTGEEIGGDKQRSRNIFPRVDRSAQDTDPNWTAPVVRLLGCQAARGRFVPDRPTPVPAAISREANGADARCERKGSPSGTLQPQPLGSEVSRGSVPHKRLTISVR